MVRTVFVVVMSLVTALLAGCSAAAPAPGPPATRTVEQALGRVEVPVEPKRVLVLDEYAALNMLSLGLRPDVVFATVDSRVGVAVLRDEGIEVRDERTFLESPDIEKVAAVHPDMIVMSHAGPLTPLFEQMNTVAPTIALSYLAPWREGLASAGAALDRRAESAALTAKLEQRIAGIRPAVDGKSLSILFGYAGEIFTPVDATPLSDLVTSAGYTRIRSEQGLPGTQDGTIAPISGEVLGAHDADRTALLDGGYYEAGPVRSAPAWSRLPVARQGRATDVDGDMWFGNHPFATSWILDDLEAIAAGRPAGTVDDAAARWAAFGALRG